MEEKNGASFFEEASPKRDKGYLEGSPYLFTTNLVGAILACLASLLMAYYPFVLLEGTWTIVSLIALIQYIRNSALRRSKKVGKSSQT